MRSASPARGGTGFGGRLNTRAGSLLDHFERLHPEADDDVSEGRQDGGHLLLYLGDQRLRRRRAVGVLEGVVLEPGDDPAGLGLTALLRYLLGPSSVRHPRARRWPPRRRRPPARG